MSKSKLEDFEITGKLGQGSFGVVYKVKRKSNKEIYVLKQIDLSRMGRSQRAECAKEAQLMAKLNHKYIVKLYDTFTQDSKINIIMELCENGDLGLYLKK
jgi:serine/threonine protein kinase